MREDNRKPNCPICGGEIELVTFSFYGTSANPSVLLGGSFEQTFYRCKNNYHVCSESVSIADAWFDHWNKPELNTRRGKNWREALKRFHHYCDFMDDHNRLKEKLLARCDKYGDIPGGSLAEEYPDFDPVEEAKRKRAKKQGK